MKKYVLWPLLAAIGGVGAFLLRLLQRSTGFEVDTGLPIPGNLYAILLVAWFVVLAAVCLLVARPLLPADREDPPLFPTGFSVASPGLLTPAVMGLFLLAASGVLDLLFGFSGASALTGSGETVTVFVTAQGSQLFSGQVWVSDLPYLQAVSSPEPADSIPNYYSRVEFTAEEFREKVLTSYPEADLSGDISGWLQNAVTDTAGSVESVDVGGVSMKGSTLRSILGLRSACFEWEAADGKLVFFVTGYGHGVGMSQYGANQMAKEGADYRTILTHYYTGVTVEPYTTAAMG